MRLNFSIVNLEFICDLLVDYWDLIIMISLATI